MAEKRAVKDMLAQAAELAAPVFAAAGWKWSGPTGADDESYTPGAAAIALNLGSLARSVIEADNAGGSWSGRFGVTVDDDPDESQIGITVVLELGTTYIERYPRV